MANLGNLQWATNTINYTEEQIGSVLNGINITVESETYNDFLCYCPFHGNTETPSFSVSKRTGTYICFNAACAETGNLNSLVQRMRKCTVMEALRFILKRKEETKAVDFVERLQKQFDMNDVQFNIMPAAPFERMYNDFWSYPDAVLYMVDQRGFEEDTLNDFKIGYSVRNDMVIVPMHDPIGQHIGLIGRSIEGKRFKNSQGLPVSKTLWNLHRAKKAGDTVIVCEASFDAMRIHQAGYPNVVALLGGNLSTVHIQMLEKHFDHVVIMTDFDDKEKHKTPMCRKCPAACKGHNPGRDLGTAIANKVRRRISWASYGYKEVYPNGAKDCGDLTDDEIVQCIKNAASNFEYVGWQLY